MTILIVAMVTVIAAGFAEDWFTLAAADSAVPLRLPIRLHDAACEVHNGRGPALVVPPLPGRAALAPPERESARSSRAGVGLQDTAAVQVNRVVPASANLAVCGQQFWLGPAYAGRQISLWADRRPPDA